MNNRFKLTALSAIILLFSISAALLCETGKNAVFQKKPKYVNGVYRVPMDMREGKNIWIVDGLIIRREIYPEFLYGGNAQRYLFIPKNEIWIDHAISAEEYDYTLAHELHERNLMARYGMSYADAHDSSLALEHRMRLADKFKAEEHEKSIGPVPPRDCDGIKEIATLPDSIRLKNIYRKFIRSEDGIEIWIVDGSDVRKNIFPDYGLSGNDLVYKFIPPKEIWIDGDISCEETEFSITSELVERKLMSQTKDYDSAYMKALDAVSAERIKADKLSRSHPALMVPEKLDRDTGTGSEKTEH